MGYDGQKTLSSQHLREITSTGLFEPGYLAMDELVSRGAIDFQHV